MASLLSGYNIPLLSIPAYYIIAAFPKFISTNIEMKVFGVKDNVNPRGQHVSEALKAKLSTAEFQRWERTENCHKNCLENMPVFLAAVFAGLFAEQRTGKSLSVSTYALSLLAVRIMYVANYMTTTTQNWSYVRSILFNVGTVLCLTLVVRSAGAIGR